MEPIRDTQLNPVTLQVINSKLNGVVEEMQRIIYRTGYSTVIRESKDASAGITDSKGRLIGQAFQLPLHIGVFTHAVNGISSYYDESQIENGDVFIVNHPYLGGSPHASDFIVATPFFHHGGILAYCCNIAHKADIGGMVPGSLTTKATEIFQEGLQIPPVKYFQRGKLSTDIENIIKSNSRIPDQIIGDLRGQVGCTLIGKQRLSQIVERYGADSVVAAADETIRRTKTRLIALIRNIPEEWKESEGYLDHDGVDLTKPKRIHVKVGRESDSFVFDFSKSDSQTKGSLNMRPTLLRAICNFATIAFLDPTLSSNHALFETVKIVTENGTIVDPRYPAAVSSYADIVRLSYHIVIDAVGKLFPSKAVACGGDNRGLNISGTDMTSSKRWIFYEILGSGQGAKQDSDGISGISHFISNVAITPIEIVETEFPIMISSFELIRDSGGAGKFRGGLGFRRSYHFLQDCTYVHRTGVFYLHAPWGLNHGKSGRTATFSVIRANGSIEKINHVPGEYSMLKGDTVVVERPGGGGCGDSTLRNETNVIGDILDGYVSEEASLKEYGRTIESSVGEKSNSIGTMRIAPAN